jgi:hypothetical protein
MEDHNQTLGERGKCSCWVVMRGDEARPDGWESAEYELMPNPSCPVHGKKTHLMMEDDEGCEGD